MRTNFSEFFSFNLILFFIVFCAMSKVKHTHFGKNSMQKVKGEHPFCRVIATLKFVLYSLRLFP